VIEVPQPGMFKDWKEWADQLITRLLAYDPPPPRAIADLGNYASDAAAAAGGVPIGGLYRNGSFVSVRVS
jgi:hypothetical protein